MKLVQHLFIFALLLNHTHFTPRWDFVKVIGTSLE